MIRPEQIRSNVAAVRREDEVEVVGDAGDALCLDVLDSNVVGVVMVRLPDAAVRPIFACFPGRETFSGSSCLERSQKQAKLNCWTSPKECSNLFHRAPFKAIAGGAGG